MTKADESYDLRLTQAAFISTYFYLRERPSIPCFYAQSRKTMGPMAGTSQLRCIHCGKPADETTKDHVFPASWYPQTTPEDTQRWTAPSCSECNNSLGSIEKKVFSRLILCVDSQKAEAKGLYAKLKLSLGMGVVGLSKKEAEHREKQKTALISAMKPYSAEGGASTLPGLHSHTGFDDEELPQIRIPGDLLLKVYEKVVRGCEYVLADRIIEEPYCLKIYFVHKSDLPKDIVRGLASPAAKESHVGPGFRVVRVAAQDDPYTALYEITLWESAYFFASIMNRSN